MPRKPRPTGPRPPPPPPPPKVQASHSPSKTHVISGTLISASHGVHLLHTTGTFEIILPERSVFPPLKAGSKPHLVIEIIEEPSDARQ